MTVFENIFLIFFLPLWIFLIIMAGRFCAVYIHRGIIYALTLFSSAFSTAVCGGLIRELKPDEALDFTLPFIKINDFTINAGFLVDRESLIFAGVLFAVSFFVQLFSISYMREDKKGYRFFALMNLFNFSMAGLFFSPNLYQSYFFWEISGVVSYLLIGFEYFKPEKSLAAKKVFILNRIGDTAFLGAIILSSYFMYNYSPSTMLTQLPFEDINSVTAFVYGFSSTETYYLICGLFLIAAFVKSAQFPFYTWLQDAMEAKLPVSALLHSATLVASGIFIFIRLLPVFEAVPVVLKAAAVLGAATLVVCSLCASVQTHPKKALAYSTSAQLGLMFYLLGSGFVKGAVLLFISHALIKSVLFLSLPDEGKRWNIAGAAVFLISGLSLCGLILSGFAVKESVFSVTDGTGRLVLGLSGALGAYYILRIMYLIIREHGICRSGAEFWRAVSITGLFVLNILMFVYLIERNEMQLSLPFWMALGGAFVVGAQILFKAFWRIPLIYPILYQGLYLDKLYTGVFCRIYDYFCEFLSWFDQKVLSDTRIVVWAAKIPVKITSWVEENIMNRTVRGVEKTFKGLANIELRVQNGSIQRYNAYAFVIITLLITGLIGAYTVIISFIGG